MAIYEIYLPPENRFAGHVRHEQAKPVGDRASILALIFPLIWLIYHRLWFWTGVYLLIAFLLNGLAATPLAVIGLTMTFIPGLFVYLEGPNMITAKLETDGYTLAGIVEAHDGDAALMRWLERSETEIPAPVSPVPQPFAPRIRSAGEDGGLGLFGQN